MNPDVIENVKSERVRRVADLAKSHGRKKAGRFLVEGPQSVREAVRWVPTALVDVYVQMGDGPQGLFSKVVADIVDEADRRGLYIHHVTASVMHKMSDDSQGIVAVAQTETFESVMQKRFAAFANSTFLLPDRKTDGSENPTSMANAVPARGRRMAPGDLSKVVVKADAHTNSDAEPTTVAAFWQVRDPGNAGTVIRSADAAGCAAAIFVDDCVDRFNPKVIRSTAGSLFHIPVVTMTTDEFFDWARSDGREVMAADVYGTPEVRPESLVEVIGGDLHTYRMPSDRQTAGDEVRNDGRSSRTVLFGNEARGLPAEVLGRVDRIVSIPLYGKAESLNLATSAAVMLFSLAMSSHIETMGRL